MKTNADVVREYDMAIARCILEKNEIERALINAVEVGTSELEKIILFGHQMVEISTKIGTLSAMRYVYEKEAPDADSHLTVPF